MSRKCSVDVTKGPMSGNKVSHSNRKTRRRFLPNLQNLSFFSDILGKAVSLRLAPSTARSIEHNNGIDSYLLKTSNTKLTEVAQRLKRMIAKVAKSKSSNAA